jgi:hypothetical protein
MNKEKWPKRYICGKSRGWTDKYGRTWGSLTRKELCPVCGQPDNCGDCNHKKLSAQNVIDLIVKILGRP